MKINLLLTTALIASLFLFSGCGGGDDTGVSTSDLKGSWTEICKNRGGTSSYNTVLDFTRTDLTRSSYEYDDIGCNTRDIVKHIDVYYTYTLGEDVKTVDGKDATKIAMHVTGYKVESGTYQGDDVPQVGATERDIVYINNRMLYIGEDKEPYTLDYNDYFIKK